MDAGSRGMSEAEMTDAAGLHDDALVFDGLNVCNWSRGIFEEMHEGGVTAVNCASVIWEDLAGGLRYVMEWRRMIAENADLLIPVQRVADIRRAKRDGRTGICLGWQNTSPLQDQLGYVEIFRDLGVRIMQLTYNTQNYSGAGYLEASDGGLTGFGHDVLAEMNRVGVLCDLSHVGDRTAAETIAASAKPVCFSHVLPRALRDVKRNKPDDLLRACADRGGIIGISLFAPGMAAGNDATLDDYLAAMAYVIDLVGEDHVGIGTDFSLDHPRPGPYMEWANRDKGYGRKLTEFGHVKINKPKGIERIRLMPNLTAAMLRAGWGETRIRKLLGLNWLRVLGDVWGE
jgi:membrane dipeptidase